MQSADLDLRELLSFRPDGGTMFFMGRRAIIFDAVALGLLRKELINSLGMAAARSILTRFGYAHGRMTAESLKLEFPDLFADSWTGPKLHMLQGMVRVEENKRSDGSDDQPLVQSFWYDSYEVEQHLLHLGLSEDSVCWTLTGFASGYVSYWRGEKVYFIEDRCCGKGDAVCHVEGRTREQWGEALEPYLPYFESESGDEVFQNLAKALRDTEERLKKQRRQMSCLSAGGEEFGCITARSGAMRQVVELTRRIARVDSSVIVTGESGAGKERIARLIHEESARAGRPFVAVNCGALTETLLESELFGHAKGAFTGADRDKMGLIEAANGGTLFLDEIGEVSQSMQVKLLRVLQEREVRRVGENKSRQVDIRVVAATNRNLSDEVSKGNFRRDLYYRLRVIEVRVPPLRERNEDILPLARIFLEQASKRAGRKVTGFTPKAADQLLRYTWPGNVRELQNAVEHAVALCLDSRADLEDLPEELRSALPRPGIVETVRPLEEVEREYILAALRATGNNKARTAAELNIGIATLYRKLAGYEKQGFLA
ncbi:sigma-54-dependent Fis family transcriptional regulator [Geomonas subterranea]|uniref:Sigma-54-dependent Fis family transcriptional regulator n=1 Tax=Geomonas subterranea TaxID=2847989 RepID=A0ABX8LTL6_9BACT|nr:sigma-54-dependent Fis family transcriptional regulator [Geomonas subterranea]QXE92835.1 sigma-54-dependent Fis family transcriptional regulator [Geomonas subterranea]QXM09060.1 sigma-54-dependent Fis family transcriptional regulator [Geomonas subterranea]